MAVNALRIKNHTGVFFTSGTVVYQMCRDIRVHDNDALLFAQELAKSAGSQLVVNYVIWNYKWEGATRRFYDWVLPSLREVEEALRLYNIPLVITFEEKKLFDDEEERTPVPTSIGAVVIEESPLRYMRRFKELFIKHNSHVPLYEVDAHNVIPVWETSSKQEFAARTIRSKIHNKVDAFLKEYEALTFHKENDALMQHHEMIDWNFISDKIICDERVTGTGEFVPGEKAAKEMLSLFLDEKLPAYAEARNNINEDGSSNLSPYIAHGNISRRRILLTLCQEKKVTIQEAFSSVSNGSNGKEGSTASFVEECLVRAELSENFCYYNEEYDSFAGFPSWAKETLTRAATDTREYCYTREQFEQALTHDELWNAAQMQMVRNGKMHGYMRMYWAKKILEWSKSPKEAMRRAVYLNDTYELDGRDPNGYVGCAWSIGGVHDRPWFGRPIFGTVRYMAKSGVEKRGGIKEFKWHFLQQGETLF